jgi:hypothetical protein
LPVDEIDNLYSVNIKFHVEYGHPDRFMRKASKEMEVELLPSGQGLHMIYVIDDDAPIQKP